MKLPLRLAATASAVAALASIPAAAMPAADPAPAASSAKPYKWEGYSDKPVEAKLGPYRFRFPMNMYYDQMGPDFQGGVVLVLQWPSLEPYPPGENFHDTPERFLSAISIDLDHAGRLSDEEYATVMRKSLWSRSSDPAHREDPSANLNLRIRGKPIFGLTPYYLDLVRLQAYLNKLYAPNPPVAEPDDSMNSDWYVVFGTNYTPSTFIKCAPKGIPDGIVIRGDIVADDPNERQRALCTHQFLIPEYKLYVRISYPRPFLKHWQSIETRVRDLLNHSLAH